MCLRQSPGALARVKIKTGGSRCALDMHTMICVFTCKLVLTA
jgi:hypothetical protein